MGEKADVWLITNVLDEKRLLGTGRANSTAGGGEMKVCSGPTSVRLAR